MGDLQDLAARLAIDGVEIVLQHVGEPRQGLDPVQLGMIDDPGRRRASPLRSTKNHRFWNSHSAVP
jgi:hypothetical protein